MYLRIQLCRLRLEIVQVNCSIPGTIDALALRDRVGEL